MNQELRDKLFGRFSGTGPLFDVLTGGFKQGELAMIHSPIPGWDLPKSDLKGRFIREGILSGKIDPKNIIFTEWDFEGQFLDKKKIDSILGKWELEKHYIEALAYGQAKESWLSRAIKNTYGIPPAKQIVFKSLADDLMGSLGTWSPREHQLQNTSVTQDVLSVKCWDGSPTPVRRLAQKYEFNQGEWWARNSVSGALGSTKHYYALHSGDFVDPVWEGDQPISYPTIGGDVFSKLGDIDSISPILPLKHWSDPHLGTKSSVPERKDRIPHMKRGGYKGNRK
jgi:hypothetical protein